MALSAIFLVALSLSMDCFAVALAGSVSMQRLSYNQVVRASFAFGFFQAGMLVLGWLVGQAVVDIIAGYAYWVAFVLLGLVGVRMIWESLSSGSESRQHTDITKGFALLTLSIATSIDALAVGLGLALLESRILLAVIVVGLVTFFVAGAGFYLGRKIGILLGQWAGIIGGVILIGLGFSILLGVM